MDSHRDLAVGRIVGLGLESVLAVRQQKSQREIWLVASDDIADPDVVVGGTVQRRVGSAVRRADRQLPPLLSLNEPRGPVRIDAVDAGSETARGGRLGYGINVLGTLAIAECVI